MAYDPTTGKWTPDERDESVSGRVTGLLSQHSPLMKQARTQGLQTANRRGLLNSSMAVQAGQDSAYRVAVPIASQEAAQATSRNMQDMDLASQYTAQGRDMASREKMQRLDIAAQKELTRWQLDSQQKIASMNIASHDRQAAQQALAAADASYAQMFSNIAANPNIPSKVRDKYLSNIESLRDSGLQMVEQMYDVKLDWQQSQAGSSGGGDSQPQPPARANAPYLDDERGVWVYPGQSGGGR